MIDKDQLAAACRAVDDLAEGGVPAVAAALGVDVGALLYVANQRGLRAAMIADGQDPTAMSPTEPTPVHLGEDKAAMHALLAAAALDGIVIGLRAAMAARAGGA